METTTNREVCYPVSYQLHEQRAKIDISWIVIAISTGVLLGILLALIVFYFCCKRLWKNTNNTYRQFLCTVPTIKKNLRKIGIASNPTQTVDLLTKNETLCNGFADEVAAIVAPPGAGLSEVVMQDNGNDAESELIKQDVSATAEIEEELLKNRNMISKKLAVIHLNDKNEGTVVDREAIEKVMAELESRLIQTEQKLNADFKTNLEMLADQSDMNDQKLSEEINKLKAAHKRSLHVLFKNALEEFREILRKNTKLSEQEIEEIVEKLKRSLANLESILNENVEDQAQFLENNFAQRKYLTEQILDVDNNIDKKMEDYEKSCNKILTKLVDDKKLAGNVKNGIYKQFQQALENVKSKHRADLKAEMKELAEKLKKQRIGRLSDLKNSHREQLNKLLKQAESMTDPERFLTLIKELLDQQTEEMQDEKMDIDKDEANKLNQIYLKLQKSYEVGLLRQLEMLRDKLSSETKLGSNETKLLLQEFEMDLKEMEKVREVNRTIHLAKLREKLEERKRSIEQQAVHKDSEQRRIVQQQDNVLQKVLDGQRELDESDRHQILLEHEHNQLVLNSILSLSKIKHERLLEQKLAARRASVNSGAENVARSTGTSGSKETLTKRDEAELVQESRDSLALETNALLEQQDTNLAELIGRLQVSQARRQTMIERQDKLVKRLENELKQQPAKNLSNDELHHLDTILVDHKRQVEQLNKVLENTKQRQLQNLQAKLEEKRLRNKKALEAKFEAEEESILTKSLNNKMSFATSLLCQNKLSTRHQRALEHLNSEINAETERQKEHLNRELQKELEKLLLEQKKQFLGQLANVINMTPNEIKAMAKQSHKQDRVETSLNSAPNFEANHPTGVTNRLPPIGKSILAGNAPPVGMDLISHDTALELAAPAGSGAPRKRHGKKRRSQKRRPSDAREVDDDSDYV